MSERGEGGVEERLTAGREKRETMKLEQQRGRRAPGGEMSEEICREEGGTEVGQM